VKLPLHEVVGQTRVDQHELQSRVAGVAGRITALAAQQGTAAIGQWKAADRLKPGPRQPCLYICCPIGQYASLDLSLSGMVFQPVPAFPFPATSAVTHRPPIAFPAPRLPNPD
jgi:hypothetical protein